jgi:hypothetical protein
MDSDTGSRMGVRINHRRGGVDQGSHEEKQQFTA